MNKPMTPEQRYRRENEQREVGVKIAKRRARRGWRRWLAAIAVAASAALGLGTVAAACTPTQVFWYKLAKQCQGNNTGFCRCVFGPNGVGDPYYCWGVWG